MTRHTDKQPAPANRHATPVHVLADDHAAVAMFVAWVNGEPIARIVTVHDDMPGHIVSPVTPKRQDG